MMAEKHAIIVAVETYRDPAFTRVKYAEDDAKAISATLQLHGYSSDRMSVLTSASATKAPIESTFRTVCAGIREDDTLLVFYAGHGFSDGVRNYITCHDSLKRDLVATSVSIQSLLDEIRASLCKHVVLLLDCCHSGLPIDSSMRGIVGDLSEDDFTKFCEGAEYHLGFAACRVDQKSYCSDKLKHGIWTYHVVEALEGRNTKALERGRYVTASSLRDFLSDEVPRTIRNTFSDMRVQTPRCWGDLSREFILADLGPTLAKRAAEKASGLGELKRISLLGYTWGAIKRLSGFKRHHHVPEEANETTRSFVLSIGSKELNDYANSVHSDLKKEFSYKRQDLSLDIDDGSATIISPDFRIDIEMGIDDEDPSRYFISTEATNISNPAAVTDEAFANTFEETFDQLVLESTGTVDVRGIIDAVEAVDDASVVSVDYPASSDECTIDIPGYDARLRFSGSQLTISLRRGASVRALLACFRLLPNVLTEHKIAGFIGAGSG